MKKLLYVTAAASLLFTACSKDSTDVIGMGKIAINTKVEPTITLKAPIPADNFNLKITANSDATVKYDGKVSAFTSPMELPVGTYTVAVVSEPFTAPAFDKPVYGISKTDVAIADGQTTTVDLVAKQTNAALKLVYHADMVKYCTNNGYAYSAEVVSDAGNLAYDNTETRFGYFIPGQVTVKVTMNGKLYSQDFTLTAADLKTVTVNVTPKPAVPSQIGLTITGEDIPLYRDVDWTFDEVAGATPTVKLKEEFTGLSGDNTTTGGSATAWTGNSNFPAASLVKISQAGNAIKLGSSSSTNGTGSLETKTLDLSSNSGYVIVRFKVKGWLTPGSNPNSTLGGTIDVSLGTTTKPVPYKAGANVTDFQTVEVAFTNGAPNQKVKLASVKTGTESRAYIDDVEIIN